MLAIEQRIERVRLCLVQLKGRLEAAGYEFQEPGSVLPGPDAEVDHALRRLQQEVGPVPLALRLFYQKIGSVNLLGHHPDWEDWEGAYSDPLLVYPVTVALEELDEFLSNRDSHVESFGGFRVPISPDYYHKADVSGGMWYNIALPDLSDDPQLLDEWHQTTFVDYLEIALRWGGFPGVERWGYKGHNWPLAGLAEGFSFGS